ncbi:MAG TPA: hypothetical protein VGK13_00900 [Methanocellaceae archaeon]
MSDIHVILQNSILYTAGIEGLARFNKAVDNGSVSSIVGSDGSLDLSRLMNMLLDVFHEEQASSIMDNTLARYMEIANEQQANEYAALEAGIPEIAKPAGTSVSGENIQESSVASAQAYGEDELAEYFESDASEVRDMINEARRIRTAMGKSTPKISRKINIPTPTAEEPRTPPPMNTIRKASKSMSLSNETLDTEIDDILGQSALSSIDPMDVIRHLKEKGYYFQENTVLEKVYSRIEERKNKIRDWILHDIQIFLENKTWPNEEDVVSYVKHIKDIGIVYDESEIRRMILIEMIRKA